MAEKSTRFSTIWNMSFGFLGIQFGWALQMANMSAIYEYLGAKPDQIPMLWLAAPLTGLLIQPIIGHLSDNTWSPRFGRRSGCTGCGRSPGTARTDGPHHARFADIPPSLPIDPVRYPPARPA